MTLARRATLALVGALAVFGPATRARAEDVEVGSRRMAFAERGADLVVSTRFPELFDAAALAAVSSGLPVTVVVRLYVYRGAGEQPVSLAALQYDLVYDLWDEVYVVRTRGPHVGSAQARLTSRSKAIEAVTSLREVPAAALDRVPIGPHHFAALVAELNPVSDELLAEMRRWLTRRAGDRLDASSSFFGSFVSVFVNPKLEGAERIVRLRSQPFYRVAR